MQIIDWPGTFAQNAGTFMFLCLVYFTLWFYTAWHCLANAKGVDRLTWLVALLGMPIVGIVFYWLRGADEHRKTFKTLEDL